MTAAAQLSPASATAPTPSKNLIANGYDVALHPTITDAVRAHWQGVFSRIGNPTLFQHIAWHEAFLDSRHKPLEHGEALLALVSRGDQPQAVIPLLFSRRSRAGMPVRTIELMFPTDMGVRDLPMADGAESGQILDLVLNDVLPRAGYRWDIASFPDIAAGSGADISLNRLTTAHKLASYHHDSNRLKCGSERGQPFAHVSKSHIKKTKRKRKSLDALGTVTCEFITDFAALPQALDLFIELENAGWKGTGGEKTSLHHDLPQKAFYESLVNNTESNLHTCFAIMRLDGKPIAINLCTRNGDTLWMLKITYADDLQEHSPGNLILLYLLEQFAGDADIKYISFITGGDWTLRWHPEQLPVANIDLFAGTLRGTLLASINYAKQAARRIKHAVKTKPPRKVSEDE